MSEAALVTGAARRIGAAIARRLAGAGYAVALHSSEGSRPEAEALARLIGEEGGRAHALAADLVAADAPAMIVADARAALGPLTLLVNSAAVFEADEAAAPDPALWDRQFAVNLRAPVMLAASFLAQVPDGRDASVVNIVDQRVLHPDPRSFSYTLSKAALWTATRTMAQAFAPRGVRVNAVGPGPTLPNRQDGEAAFAREVAGVPLARPVEPAEIADAVLFLARARSVTGQMLAVDSGQHLGWRTPDVLG